MVITVKLGCPRLENQFFPTCQAAMVRIGRSSQGKRSHTQFVNQTFPITLCHATPLIFVWQVFLRCLFAYSKFLIDQKIDQPIVTRFLCSYFMLGFKIRIQIREVAIDFISNCCVCKNLHLSGSVAHGMYRLDNLRQKLWL